jgi:hypothetical protein
MPATARPIERLHAHARFYRDIALYSDREDDRLALEKKAQECDELAELARGSERPIQAGKCLY